MLRRIISYVLILTVLLAAFPVCFAKNDPPPYQQDDKFARINQDLDNCPELVAQNIADMANDTSLAPEVEGQTAAIQENMAEFEKASTNLKRTMWWKNPGAKVGIVGAIAVIVTAIVGGITWIVTAVKNHK